MPSGSTFPVTTVCTTDWAAVLMTWMLSVPLM